MSGKRPFDTHHHDIREFPKWLTAQNCQPFFESQFISDFFVEVKKENRIQQNSHQCGSGCRQTNLCQAGIRLNAHII